MSFMQPEIIHDLFLIVETRDGDTVIPADAAFSQKWTEALFVPHCAGMGAARYEAEDHPEEWPEWEACLRPYLETSAPIQSITARYAFGARLSAPGYMDCTEWSLYDSEEEAREGLADVYGDDQEGEAPL
jgi:hypothetical protein